MPIIITSSSVEMEMWRTPDSEKLWVEALVAQQRSTKTLRNLSLTAVDLSQTLRCLCVFCHPPKNHSRIHWHHSQWHCDRYSNPCDILHCYHQHVCIRDTLSNKPSPNIRIPIATSRIVWTTRHNGLPQFTRRLRSSAKLPELRQRSQRTSYAQWLDHASVDARSRA